MLASIALGFTTAYVGRAKGENDSIIWLGIALVVAGCLYELMRPKQESSDGGE
jgi:hypothetical protein